MEHNTGYIGIYIVKECIVVDIHFMARINVYKCVFNKLYQKRTICSNVYCIFLQQYYVATYQLYLCKT